MRTSAVLGGIALLAIAGPLVVIQRAPAVPRAIAAKVRPPQRVAPPTELPEVEPVELQDLTAEEARAYNAGIAFVRGPKPAAQPFRFAGDAAALLRATDCLAAASWYEAGDDPAGQRAVAQVVLNRLRHPAFPKTVCGVVFQGAERSTGCQFTFTCDGALARHPSGPAWERARRVAADALAGKVEKKIGYATHYHTDWVVPYWSSSLDKIAEVHTHLFFRWTGWWGTPAAFRRTVSSAEPVIAALAAVSPAHQLSAAQAEADAVTAAAVPLLTGAPGPAPAATPLPDDEDAFAMLLGRDSPERYVDVARGACGERARCKFMGWTDRAQLPGSATMAPQQIAAMSFSYLRNKDAGIERMLWNCKEFPRTGPGLCMRRQPVSQLAPPSGPLPTGPEPLDGVRRREGASGRSPSPEGEGLGRGASSGATPAAKPHVQPLS
ncbi:cell wall hydrolase [Sphingomonas yunnanensis]|uniref:cell wall hydrolase n=1 Tax=Sphingomonas yunnanensis TaxID=310400 RepID=UPI001CA68ABC|nr:cell wall hydrolase [Sphingomonas yunnanensis]MBY9061605.1 cell wall hydrolase [Sphingomonas yunnanensis]